MDVAGARVRLLAALNKRIDMRDAEMEVGEGKEKGGGTADGSLERGRNT